MITKNPILKTDSYKISHDKQYPAGATGIFDYVEARFSDSDMDRTVVMGVQPLIEEYLTVPVTSADVDEAEAFYILHGVPFIRENWDYIVDVHSGYLPVEIYAVPEGTVVPLGNALVTVESIDKNCVWLVSHLETAILRGIWYPTTVATNSWYIKQDIKRVIEQTSDNPESIAFKLHDFGSRGVSSSESAALGGMAHLVNFMGSDTVEGIYAANTYYDIDMAGFSIAASEHSTITAWGKDSEVDAYRNMLAQFAKPGSMVAIVSDSYDLDNAVRNIFGDALKQEIIDSGATVIIRPDSGHPANIVVRTVNSLMEKFGFTTNSKGYKVLPDCIRVIQGDGINRTSINEIMDALIFNGISIDNVNFGMGGALLQQINRDTFGFAMKCSAIEIVGEWRDVFKAPKTDMTKASKKGRITLVRSPDGGYSTILLNDLAKKVDNGFEDVMYMVFRRGIQFNRLTFDEVRSNSNK